MKTMFRILVAVGSVALLSACGGGGNNNSNHAASCYQQGGYGGYQSSTYYNPACYNQGYGGAGMNCQIGSCPAGMGWSCDKMTCLAVAPCIGADRQVQYGAIPGLTYGLFTQTNTCWPLKMY